jgi:hypothetical protein
MEFELVLTADAQETLEEIASDPKRHRKVLRCLEKLEHDPHHPGLQSHSYEAFDKVYGEKVWESYVENQTPAAWRVWWVYGPAQGQITVLMIGPHP